MTDSKQITNTVPQTDGATALAPTAEQQLAQFHEHELVISQQGLDFVPGQIKIIKDACLFQDELGETFKELVGVVVFKQKTRGYWPKDQADDDKVPACSSQDGITGIDRDQVVHDCATCPFNAWGTGVDENGDPTKGKACKEMRRLFIVRRGNVMPETVRMSPMSLKPHDKHFSARLQRGIADIDRQTVITLHQEGSGKKIYAVADFKLGDEIPMEQRIKFAAMRSAVKEFAEKMGVTADDYDTTEAQTEEPVY